MPKSNKDAKEVERLKESYNNQKTTMDKIWFFMLTSAKIGIIQADYFTDSEREQYETLINEDKKAADIMKRVIDESIILKREGKSKSTLLPDIEKKSGYTELRNEVKAFVVKDGINKLSTVELKKYMQDISFGFKVKRFVTDRIEKSLEAKPVKKSSVKKQGVNKNKAPGIN